MRYLALAASGGRPLYLYVVMLACILGLIGIAASTFLARRLPWRGDQPTIWDATTYPTDPTAPPRAKQDSPIADSTRSAAPPREAPPVKSSQPRKSTTGTATGTARQPARRKA